MIMSMAVRNISRKSPRTTCEAGDDERESAHRPHDSSQGEKVERTDMPGMSVVRTLSVPGKSAWMMAEPVMPPRICEIVRRTARIGVRTPTRNIPSETAGLKRPPETLRGRKVSATRAERRGEDRALERRTGRRSRRRQRGRSRRRERCRGLCEGGRRGVSVGSRGVEEKGGDGDARFEVLGVDAAVPSCPAWVPPVMLVAGTLATL